MTVEYTTTLKKSCLLQLVTIMIYFILFMISGTEEIFKLVAVGGKLRNLFLMIGYTEMYSGIL